MKERRRKLSKIIDGDILKDQICSCCPNSLTVTDLSSEILFPMLINYVHLVQTMWHRWNAWDHQSAPGQVTAFIGGFTGDIQLWTFNLPWEGVTGVHDWWCVPHLILVWYRVSDDIKAQLLCFCSKLDRAGMHGWKDSRFA